MRFPRGDERHPPAVAIFASSSADPSVEPLSTTTIWSNCRARIWRSDHSKSAVSSSVLYETVITATRSGVVGGSRPADKAVRHARSMLGRGRP